MHQRAAAPAGRPRGASRPLERRAGDRRRAARPRRQLAVLLRQGAVARDPHRAVRAGHRHPAGGAQGAGRAPARVVRRALDHLDLRPLRGERPLLPGAAAARRRRGPGRGARRAATCPRLPRAAAAQRHDLPLEPARLRRRRTARPHLRVENRVLPAGPTVVDMLANAAFYYGLVRVLVEEDRPVWSQMSFSAAEENFHAGARDGIDARVYWPGVGEVPVDRAGAAAPAAAGPRRARALGRRPGRPRPPARDHRAALPDGRNGAAWQAATFHTLYEDEKLDRDEALRRMTVRTQLHALERAGAHLAGGVGEPLKGHPWVLDRQGRGGGRQRSRDAAHGEPGYRHPAAGRGARSRRGRPWAATRRTHGSRSLGMGELKNRGGAPHPRRVEPYVVALARGDHPPRSQGRLLGPAAPDDEARHLVLELAHAGEREP